MFLSFLYFLMFLSVCSTQRIVVIPLRLTLGLRRGQATWHTVAEATLGTSYHGSPSFHTIRMNEIYSVSQMFPVHHWNIYPNTIFNSFKRMPKWSLWDKGQFIKYSKIWEPATTIWVNTSFQCIFILGFSLTYVALQKTVPETPIMILWRQQERNW